MQNLLCNTYQTNYLKPVIMNKKFTIFNDYSYLVVIMLCLPAWNSMQAKDPEAYAVLDKETCTLTFKYDT